MAEAGRQSGRAPQASHSSRAKPAPWLRAAAGGLLLVAACGGGSADGPRPDGADSWDLVVILLDALPARALSCYGYERPTSPNLDVFAHRGLRFEEAYASASYTLASTASLFTGLAPAAHGVVGLKSNLLGEGHLTFAEVLSASGFATAGFSSNPHITPECGFDQGFEHFGHYPRDRFDVHTVPADMVGDVLDWWDGHAGERRFLYLHLLPPHQPYDPPAPHAQLFGADETPRSEGMTDVLVDLDRAGGIEADGGLAGRIRARYDAGVHYADAVFGEVLEGLDARGAADGAAVVLLSDHGEAFGEHGRLLHGSTVHREMTEVPLLARWPGCEPGVRRGPVATRDLAATLAELLDVPWPEDAATGTSFLPLWLDPDAPLSRDVVSRSVGNAPLWALRTERWTLIEHRASRAVHLFDRASDPDERVDLANAERRIAAELSHRLGRALAEGKRELERRGVKRGEVTRYRAELEALGYFDE